LVSCYFFQILTNVSTYLVNLEVIFEASISSGSDVVTEWRWGHHSRVYTVQGNGSRTFSVNVNFTEVGQVNLSVLAVNKVSTYFTFVLVDVYHEINGISLHCPVKSFATKTTSITMKMSASAKIPQGTLKAKVVNDDVSNNEIVDLSTRLSELKTSGVILSTYYTAPGNHTVTSRVFTEVDERNVSCELFVCEELQVSLTFDRYVKYNTPVLFDFVNITSFNFFYTVDFGDSTWEENRDSVLNERYNIQPFYKTYNTSGVYNITSTTCSSCECLVTRYVINILSMCSLYILYSGSGFS
jgi:hypothetical protein